MKPHPYLRAYMAGIATPTIFMLGALTIFVFVRFVLRIDYPAERVLVFPMALVPNLWGIWNVLYVAAHRRNWPLGLHGALLPLILVPCGLVMARLLGIDFITVGLAALALPAAFVMYYIVWKYVVGFLNGVLGLA